MGEFDNMNPEFVGRLQQLQQICQVDVFSGYRSPERQAQLFADAVEKYGSEEAARKWVAPPGKSNHGKGVAADLKGDLQCAKMAAPRLGLTFPMDHEPWHIEPLDVKADAEAYTTPPEAPAPVDEFHAKAQMLESFFHIGMDLGGMPGDEETQGAPSILDTPEVGPVPEADLPYDRRPGSTPTERDRAMR